MIRYMFFFRLDAGSMLHAMFSSRFDTKPGEDGSYFIDRDGTHYRYILNYLRTGELIVPNDEIIRRELLAEAKFYQVEGMINELQPKPSAVPVVQPIVVQPFKDSVILSSSQGQTLMNWLKNTPGFPSTNDQLLYRTSRDGWASFNFHSCCDNKGPTVTVIKSGDYIFGGYSEHPWKSYGSGSFKRALTSFLFSLVNPGGLPPTKISLIPGKELNSIYCHSNYGPTFGGNYDLYVANAPNSCNCCTDLGDTYQCPAGQDTQTFLTGSMNFLVSEMEVFSFKWQD
ncbi:BTB/POZ domain-containing protein KCTD18-like [Stylophora pistillata]|uniref:BTB/POZ domain-containing protein KCTD18-like n=1 Tax=Stylophora pistillata TaxID=50429 RepID=UPI000C055A7A|nr:BTB/POZ domain-containing protein KCTD18-like [Stylophora pistillata]